MPQVTPVQPTPETPAIKVECHSCGESYNPNKLYTHNDHVFCASCMEDKGFTKCDDCSEWVQETVNTQDRRTICESCANEDYCTCNHCSELVPTDDTYNCHDDYICSRCYGNYYFTCHACDEVYHIDDGNSDDDYTYCNYCWRERGQTCCCCDETSHECEEIRHVGFVCPNCKPNTKIMNYSYKPEPKFFGDVEKDKFFLGIELEVHCENIVKSLNVFNENDLDRLYVKEDGSVHHGFEIVSHPMNIAEHREFDWVDFCNRMYASGAVGNRNNHGIHIHITKTFLSEKDSLKLSWFMCNHFKEIVKLARREQCYRQYYGVDEIKKRILKDKQYSGDRNEILNWGPTNTVEFRLPLSTLRGETLLAILEFCDAAVKFIQTDISFMKCRSCWEEFLNWCKVEKYNCLVGYYIGYGMKGYVER